jgi:hypothetical protein
VLAFGADDTLWIDPREVGIGPQHAAQLEGFGRPYLLTNPETGQVMINARAVLEVFKAPEMGARWLAHVEHLIKQHKEVRARYDSTGNN